MSAYVYQQVFSLLEAQVGFDSENWEFAVN